MATSPTSPTPYVCDLPGWGADGRSTGAAVQAVIDTATGVNADGRNIAKLAAAVEFGTKGWPQDSPETPHKVTPDISFYREVYGSGKLQLPDGTVLRHWGFSDERGTQTIPSPLIRVRQGQVVHVTLKATKGPHTIHFHGIEPDSHNDGVGHTSFDVGSIYTYQWRPSEAGTFFYHCHVNTPLHVQLGLFGGLIVDPPTGPGQLWEGGPHYDHERFWVGMAMDPTWAVLDHHAGVDGADVGLNRLNPQYFLINGKVSPETLEDPDVAVTARTGETVLMRLLNANYHPQRWTWDTDVECRCSDGRPFDRGYELRSITLAPAERYDMIMRPRKPGVHRVRVETLHWITGKVLGYADTLITVTGDALPDLSPSPADPVEPGNGFPFDVPAVEAPIAPPPDLSQAAAAPGPAPAPAPAPAAPATPQTRVLGSKAKSKPKPKKKPLTLRERLKLKEKAAAKKRAEARRKAEAKLRAKAVARSKAKAKADAKAKARANAKAKLTGKVVKKPKRPSA
ncbi:MAG: hypothetical protein QOJ21_3315 [Solirubrobacteraceae bacterium]|jgi:FtsP/CotA-like multicopper oxidase with cupredoxin domain|nr:hypothetical protein [Solirubrobacteraceae bacterium]